MAEEREHSILAPSSKEWIHCGYSAKFLADKEEETSEASEFGTECHALAEFYIKQSLKIVDYVEKPITFEELMTSFKHYDDEMERLASAYANFVVQTVDYEQNRTGEKPIVLVEQILNMDYAPNTHGTADAIVIAGETLTIIDNKTGFIPVKVYEEGSLNSQLAIYGLYAYKCFERIYPIKKIRLVVFQERIHNIDDVTLDIEDLLEWEVSVLKPAAREAQNPNAEANAGNWCKYCPGRNICRARSEKAIADLDLDKKPELMTDAEIEAILPKVDFIIDYCNSIKDFCLKKALDGKKWKGFILSETTTKRKLMNEAEVAKIIIDAGFNPYAVNKLLTITELQKLVGKTKFNELVGDYIYKPKGQPILVAETNQNMEDKG